MHALHSVHITNPLRSVVCARLPCELSSIACYPASGYPPLCRAPLHRYPPSTRFAGAHRLVPSRGRSLLRCVMVARFPTPPFTLLSLFSHLRSLVPTSSSSPTAPGTRRIRPDSWARAALRSSAAHVELDGRKMGGRDPQRKAILQFVAFDVFQSRGGDDPAPRPICGGGACAHGLEHGHAAPVLSMWRSRAGRVSGYALPQRSCACSYPTVRAKAPELKVTNETKNTGLRTLQLFTHVSPGVSTALHGRSAGMQSRDGRRCGQVVYRLLLYPRISRSGLQQVTSRPARPSRPRLSVSPRTVGDETSVRVLTP